ncbi:MAG TPA: FCD domain-containing protein [Gaiellaceae bacterium]|jgi:DNA-binding FadR family transcriptional regulator
MDNEPRSSAFVESLVHRTVFKPIRQGSAVAEAVARLGQAIAIGLLRPGDQLPRETKLARSLGISVVTLRESLAILREAGLVETRRGRSGGTFVSGSLPRAATIPSSPLPPEGELQDFSDYRLVIEGGAAALAAERATDEQIAYLAELVAQMDDLTDFRAWGETDTLFHLILADASGSQHLVTAVAELRPRVYQVSALWDKNPITTLKLSNREHRAIVRAVKARQPDRARKAMAGHVESTLAIWLGLQSQLRRNHRRARSVGVKGGRRDAKRPVR